MIVRNFFLFRIRIAAGAKVDPSGHPVCSILVQQQLATRLNP